MTKRRVYNLFNLFLPALTMVILAFVSFSNFFDDLVTKGLIINSLILIYPLLFFLQGIVTALLKSNLFLSLGISTVTLIIIIVIWLNMSAVVYPFVYGFAGLLGYGIVRLIQKARTT